MIKVSAVTDFTDHLKLYLAPKAHLKFLSYGPAALVGGTFKYIFLKILENLKVVMNYASFNKN